ncbi:MAG TPA: fibronectin type III domain-containing protein [Tepidisphaeraceae bacterium]|nr:fibronectin type III domain-containing protein [Tepidisphaeraceae bacterium]
MQRPKQSIFELQPLERRLFLTAVISELPDRQISAGDYVDLYASWQDAENSDPHSATVNWGDGVIEPAYLYDWGGGGEVYAYHPYEVAGTYTVTLSVLGSDSNVGTESFTATVLRVQPQPYIDGQGTAVKGAPYTLTLSGYGSMADITHWTIDWGDGNLEIVTGNPEFALHTYTSAPQSYQITATATDAFGSYAAPYGVSVTTEAFDAPTDLRATVMSDRRIDLAWSDNSDNEVGFWVDYSVDGGTSWVNYTSTYASQTSCSVAGLLPDTAYTFRLRARHTSGSNSAFTDYVTASTLGVSAPADLQANAKSSTRIDLTWDDRSDAESTYLVESSTDAGATWSQYTSTYASQSGISVTGLSPDTAYHFRVRARDGGGNFSAYGNVAVAATNVFAAPANLTATAEAATRVRLSWVDQADEESAFYIARSIDDGRTWQEYSSTYANQTNYLASGLNPGRTYMFSVRARHVNGTYSAYSAPVTISTLAFSAPSELSATVRSGSRIDLSWQDNADDETDFRIERSLNGGASWTEYTSTYANQTNYQVTGLDPGVSYAFRVRARHSDGSYSIYSDVVTATTVAFAAPSSLSVTPLAGTDAELRWTNNSDNEADYRIEWTRDAGQTWSEYTSTYSNQTSYVMRNLDPGITYGFRVRGRHPNGSYSAYSGTVTLTAKPMVVPSGLLVVSKTTTSIELGWNDNSDNESDFRIEWSSDSGTTWSEYTSTYASQTSYVVNNLTPGTRYDFRVRARHPNGSYSAFSNVLQVLTTPLGAPSDLTADVVYGNRVDLRWSDNSEGEYAFRIELSTNGGSTWSEYTSTGGEVESLAVTGLTPGLTYKFRVRAYHNSGTYSGYSNTVTATPSGLGVPDGLQAYDYGAGQIQLYWSDNSDAETAYEVQHRVVNAATFVMHGMAGPNTTNYFIAGLDPAESYEFRVRAVKNGSHSAYSNVARAGIASIAAPTSLSAQVVSGSRVDLAWTDNASSEYSYFVERSDDNGASWSTSYNIGNNRTSYSANGLQPGVAYRFRVRAMDSAGLHSGASNAVDVVTRAVQAPSGLTATVVAGNRIDLAWTDNSDDENYVRLQRSEDGGVTWLEFATTNANQTGYAVADLLPGRTYQFRVRAQHGNGTYSGYSNTVAADTLPFSAPGAFGAVVRSGSQVDLSWADLTRSENYYRLERSTDNGSTWSEFATTNADVTGYSVTDLQPATSYLFRARAQHAAGFYSDYGTAVSASTSDFQLPTQVTATVISGSRVDLRWQDNADNEYYYRLERSTNGGVTWQEFGTTNANVTSYAVSDLQPSTAYQFRVRAQHGNGTYSGYSQVVAATTVTFAAPNKLTVGPAVRDTVELRWQDNADNEYYYRIERSTDAGSSWQEVGTTNANVTAFVVSGLAPNTNYQFRVRAQHGNGSYSAYSSTAPLAVGFAPPSNLVATVATSTRVDLSWDDDGDNEYYFRIERSADSGATWQEVGTTNAQVTSFSSTNQMPGTTYHFRVRAQHGSGAYSAFSTPAVATTVTFDRPTGLVVNRISDSRADLRWADNTDDEYYFRLERSRMAGRVGRSSRRRTRA